MQGGSPVGRRLGLPNPGDGVGLREEHYAHLMRSAASDWGVDWFEVISENYIDNFGYGLRVLEHVAGHRPIVMHGVSLSIGSAAPLDFAYLRKLRELATRFQPLWISDHLCWTGIGGINSHDLLPMPLTEESLNHTVERVLAVQDWLGRPLIIENPSSYLEFQVSHIPEWEFLARLADRTGCGLLLDLNNVHVSAVNNGFDPWAYIDALPENAVVQFHLAGPSDHGGHLIDTHDHPVPDVVWALYAHAWRRFGPVATLLEWDAHIPAFEDLVDELAKAKGVRETLEIEARTLA